MKRLFDFVVALLGLMVLSPLMFVLCLLVWLQDRHSPFYIANRMGRGEKPYRMVKLRSMVIRADANKVDSTANNDPRITTLGHFIRRLKLDEIPQLWNVLKGEMSFVGPRPNVKRETDLYTREEKRLLSVRPGITDISSIVFSDEGAILEGKPDPDLAYNQLIRPWKSRLGLLYIEHQSVALDIRLIVLTLVSAASRPSALRSLARVVNDLNGGPDLVRVAARQTPLEPAPPPGADHVVQARVVAN
ncbi:MAG: sugar transferase [Verrucomicrobia bacterium]|nr:sugar transferase [Verrucomicrobiota bacterium]